MKSMFRALFPLGFLKKFRMKTKTDIKCYDSLPPNYLEDIEKKTLRTLLVKEYVFNNELVIRDSGFCFSKRKRRFL